MTDRLFIALHPAKNLCRLFYYLGIFFSRNLMWREINKITQSFLPYITERLVSNIYQNKEFRLCCLNEIFMLKE